MGTKRQNDWVKSRGFDTQFKNTQFNAHQLINNQRRTAKISFVANIRLIHLRGCLRSINCYFKALYMRGSYSNIVKMKIICFRISIAVLETLTVSYLLLEPRGVKAKELSQRE